MLRFIKASGLLKNSWMNMTYRTSHQNAYSRSSRTWIRLKQLSVEIVISEMHVMFLILLVTIQYTVICYIYTSFTLPSQSLPTYISHYRTNLRPVTTQVAPPGRTGEALATVGVGDAQDGCGWRGGKIHWKFHVFWKPSNRKGQILFILYMYFLLGNK